MMRTPLFLAICFVAATSLRGSAREDLSNELAGRLAKHEGLPGIVAARIVDGKLVAAGAAGVRKAGDKTKIELEDKFHLGSCTKAMTATLAAILVERGSIKWDTAVGEVIAEKWVHADYRPVTLTQLLSHTGGCPGKPPPGLWLKLVFSRAKPTAQRAMLAKGVLSAAPAYAPGGGWEYSNAGYAIAGHMLELVAEKPWETLMEEELFKPLGMKSAGFRAPASGRRKVDQPWGHIAGRPAPPEPRGDNPDAIGPAGTVHCSIEDWARFALLHLEARPGRVLKKKESFAMLHRIHHEESRYGLGWISRGKRLGHDGSNTMWYSSILLDREAKSGALVCVNGGGEAAARLCNEVVTWLAVED